MLDRIKAFFKWIYDWVTVLAASAMGALSIIPDVLNALDAVDIRPLLPPDRALTILTCVAIVKAIAAMIQAKLASR